MDSILWDGALPAKIQSRCDGAGSAADGDTAKWRNRFSIRWRRSPGAVRRDPCSSCRPVGVPTPSPKLSKRFETPSRIPENGLEVLLEMLFQRRLPADRVVVKNDPVAMNV